jgi:hypothetical protein
MTNLFLVLAAAASALSSAATVDIEADDIGGISAEAYHLFCGNDLTGGDVLNEAKVDSYMGELRQQGRSQSPFMEDEMCDGQYWAGPAVPRGDSSRVLPDYMRSLLPLPPRAELLTLRSGEEAPVEENFEPGASDFTTVNFALPLAFLFVIVGTMQSGFTSLRRAEVVPQKGQ